MRTKNVVSGAVAALALAVAGCCDAQYIYCCPDGTQVLVVKAGAPAAAPAPAPVVVARRAVRAAAVAAEKPERPNRWHLRRRCSPCEPAAAAPVAAQPVVAAAPAAAEIAGTSASALRRGRKGRVILNREVIMSSPVVAAAPEPAVAAVVEPVATVEPVTVEEPAVVVAAEPAVEAPSWTKYLAPEQPAASEATGPLLQQPAMVPAEPYAVPAYAVPAAPDGRQPIVIQPIIQPIVQTGREVLSGQVQGAAPVAFVQPAYAAQQPLPVPATVAGPDFRAGMVTAPYAPPTMYPAAILAADPVVCAPGRNMSECFTLPESQLSAGPQVLTPSVSAPLSAMAPAAPRAPAAAAPGTAAPAAVQDKYGALASATEESRQVNRPEVSMPAPIGPTTTPPVAAPAEIENALDVMLGNTSPLLK